jgi:hypothetical protein
METKQTIKPFEFVHCLYNNDEAILNFLADMKDRDILKEVDLTNKCAKEKELKNYALVIRSRTDSMIVLLLFNPPLDLNADNNKYVLYAYNDLQGLCKYFRNWLGNISAKNTPIMFNALDDITRLLYYHWVQEQDKKVQVDFLG